MPDDSRRARKKKNAMKRKSPDILWVFAAIFVAGVLFSAVSEGDSGEQAAARAAAGVQFSR